MQNVDFLPDRIKARRVRRKRLWRQGYLLAVVVGAIVLWGYSWSVRVQQANAELAILQDRNENVRHMLEDRGRLEQQQAELLIKERISTQLGSRVNTLDLLFELERLMPAGVTLVSMNLEAVQLQVPVEYLAERTNMRRAAAVEPSQKEATMNRVRLILTGVAPSDVDVANFIGQLSSSKLLEDVNMGYARTTVVKGRKAREFQASCYVAR